MDEDSAQSAHTRKRRPWEPLALKAVGKVGEVLRHGGGKLTVSSVDTGEEARKPKSTG
jgi:hypothetical protein